MWRAALCSSTTERCCVQWLLSSPQALRRAPCTQQCRHGWDSGAIRSPRAFMSAGGWSSGPEGGHHTPSAGAEPIVTDGPSINGPAPLKKQRVGVEKGRMQPALRRGASPTVPSPPLSTSAPPRGSPRVALEHEAEPVRVMPVGLEAMLKKPPVPEDVLPPAPVAEPISALSDERSAGPARALEAVQSVDGEDSPPADAEETGRGLKLSSTPLVFHSLIGRMMAETSPTIVCLTPIGFGINEQRQLVVAKKDKLNAYAAALRSGETNLPPTWPVTLVRALGYILRNREIADPAAAIQQLIVVKLNSLTRSRVTMVVASSTGTVTGGEDCSNESLMEDAVDPTKSIELNEEQEKCIEIALTGRHMYIGGSAGTGKTVLLRVLSRRLKAQRLRIAMTATTGVAGCHIGGSTLHHALGVSTQGDFLRRSALLDYDVIIIDEVSMLSKRLFEDLDQVLREEAGTPTLPFGGVQIILCGDFLQLGVINEAPVTESHVFRDNFVCVRLESIVRQAADPVFAEHLQRLRLGTVPEGLLNTIKQLPPGTMVESAVNLLTTNREVQAANEKELKRLPGEPLTLTPETGITAMKYDATETLLLRTTPDFNEGVFANSVRSLLQATLDMPRASLLSLYRIYEDGHAMRVIIPPGESIAWRDAMRERFLEVAGRINELGLGATVTEIVRSGDGLHTPESEESLQRLMAKHPIAQPITFKIGARVLLRANLNARLVNGSIGTVVDFVECRIENIAHFLRTERVEDCIERYRVFCYTECGMPIPMLPVVRFHSGETMTIPPWEFVVGGTPATHYYSLSTVALPLSLAYAFTVHKVQGLTLVGRVHLELSRMWPCEHLLYVAMSRVRNPDQLSVSSFSEDLVVANKSCVEFDSSLSNAHNVEVSEALPVSSWRRCNDMIHQMRRRGASLRTLLSTASPAAPDVTTERGSIEHSVQIARRMRKLIKHTERTIRQQDARRREKLAAQGVPVGRSGGRLGAQAKVAALATSGGGGDEANSSSPSIDADLASFYTDL